MRIAMQSTDPPVLIDDRLLVTAQLEAGWGQGKDRHRSDEAGFDHHLVKPVCPQVLTKMLAGLQTGDDYQITKRSSDPAASFVSHVRPRRARQDAVDGPEPAG